MQFACVEQFSKTFVECLMKIKRKCLLFNRQTNSFAGKMNLNTSNWFPFQNQHHKIFSFCLKFCVWMDFPTIYVCCFQKAMQKICYWLRIVFPGKFPICRFVGNEIHIIYQWKQWINIKNFKDIRNCRIE